MIEKLESKNGLFYYEVKAKNGHILVTSQLYYTKASRDNSIESLLRILTDLHNEK